MPTYSYECSECGTRFEVLKKLADYATPESHCGKEATKIIVAAMVAPDYPGYESPVTGKWIEGKKAHIEDLKRSGCRVLEPGETEAFVKNREKRMDETFDKAAETMVVNAAKDIGLI